MNLANLEARVHRLTELANGLARELATVRKGDDPLLFTERNEYLAGIGDAVAGLEKARVVLCKVVERVKSGTP